jgi:hypothetical protein
MIYDMINGTYDILTLNFRVSPSLKTKPHGPDVNAGVSNGGSGRLIVGIHLSLKSQHMLRGGQTLEDGNGTSSFWNIHVDGYIMLCSIDVFCRIIHINLKWV